MNDLAILIYQILATLSPTDTWPAGLIVAMDKVWHEICLVLCSFISILLLIYESTISSYRK